MTACRQQAGFTYLAILFVVAVTGFGVASVGETWSHARQREREGELLWIGNQFKQAIGLYYERSPGGMKRYPEKLEDLLEDRRFLTTQRYLRRLYPDPITGQADWDVIAAPGGGIMGIKSRSNSRPLGPLSPASRYANREFAYEPATAVRKLNP